MLPWLLLLALLLWPLDVAVRRVSLARSDLALARAWSGARWRQWRGPARRTAEVGGMLAATRRAGGAQTRSALLNPTQTPQSPPAQQTQSAQPTPSPAAPAPPPATAPEPESTDTLARLREAKKRARGQ
jgi:hypothetical protein